MAGTRSLTQQEIELVYSSLTRTRDRVLFLFGLKTGFRITELLSIKVSHVLQHGKIVDRVKVMRSNMKGNFTRDVVIGDVLKTAIMDLINEQQLHVNDYLFKSREGGNKAIHRSQAWKILTDAFDKAQLTGSLGCHSMRKTFAKRCHEALEFDLIRTQKALGHRSITSTIAYLPIDQEEVDNAILSLD